jgi:alkylated DNA repair protein alkB homolog 7
LLYRRRYEKGHWDSVIVKYKETELLCGENDLNVRQLQDLIQSNHTLQGDWMVSHAIDLHEHGELNAHVDSVRFSGNLVAGVSLLSASIMRLVPADADGNKMEAGEAHCIDLLLPPRSLYVLSGMSRFLYTHELLPSGSPFAGNDGGDHVVRRRRRISVIFRDTKAAGGASE